MKSVAILGANGFLGSHLVDTMVVQGHKVIAVDRFLKNRQFSSQPAQILEAELAEVSMLGHAFAEDMAMIYAAGSLTPRASIGAERKLAEELGIWESLLAAFGEAGGARIFFCSSGGAVYGESPSKGSRESDTPQPLSIYGELKLRSEVLLFDLARKYGFSPIVWRFGNLYGPRQKFKAGQGFIAHALECAQSGRPLAILGDGSMRRDYTHIGDAIAACMALFNKPGKHTVYNIGTGQSASVIEVIREIEHVLQVRLAVSYKPRPSEFVQDSVLDVARLLDEYSGLSFRGLREGLRWLRRRG